MAENSKIEWCDHTQNFWVGCTKISPACDHCYAESWAKRSGSPELWAGERRRTTPANWAKPFKWNKDAMTAGVRRKVFSNSLSDFFDNQVPDQWRDDAWSVIDKTVYLDWLLLTKRPQNIAKMLPYQGAEFLWPGVWLGATVEDCAASDRIGYLRDIPAEIRFLSCEPLIEAIEPNLDGISWVICGGESGGNARMMNLAWARRLRDQCAERGVAYFFKQTTHKGPIPDDLLIRQFPKVPHE